MDRPFDVAADFLSMKQPPKLKPWWINQIKGVRRRQIGRVYIICVRAHLHPLHLMLIELDLVFFGWFLLICVISFIDEAIRKKAAFRVIQTGLCVHPSVHYLVMWFQFSSKLKSIFHSNDRKMYGDEKCTELSPLKWAETLWNEPKPFEMRYFKLKLPNYSSS